MIENKEQSYFPALTGIRAIAAYMVFLHHYNPFHPTEQKFLHDFIGEFHVGVTLFFVLSGFLIAHRYYHQTFSFKKYFLNRVARIYPMYFLLTTLTFLLPYLIIGITEKQSFSIYLSNITFLRGFFDDLKFTGIAQGWSLTVEEVFYVCAPFFFWLILRNKINLLLLPIFIMSSGILLVFLLKDASLKGLYGNFDFMFNYTFTGRCFEFFIGIGLAIFYKKAIQNNFGYYTFLGILMMIICILSIQYFKGENDYGIRHPAGVIINTFVLPLLGISVLFYGLLTENNFIQKILSSKLFVALGKSSYIFYLIHLGIIQLILMKFGITSVPLIFFLLAVISYLFFCFIEEPLNKWIRKLSI